MNNKRNQIGITPVIGILLMLTVTIGCFSIVTVASFNSVDKSEKPADAMLNVEKNNEQLKVTILRNENVDNFKLKYNKGEIIKFKSANIGHSIKTKEGGEFKIIAETESKNKEVIYQGELEKSTNFNKCPFAESDIEDNDDFDIINKKVNCNIIDDIDIDKSSIDVDISENSILIGDINVTADIDISNSTINGSMKSTGNDITITKESKIKDDIIAETGTNIDIDGDSTVEGSVVIKDDGSLSLSNSKIEGDVYVNENDLSCGSMKIGSDEKSCQNYEFKEVSEYDDEDDEDDDDDDDDEDDDDDDDDDD